MRDGVSFQSPSSFHLGRTIVYENRDWSSRRDYSQDDFLIYYQYYVDYKPCDKTPIIQPCKLSDVVVCKPAFLLLKAN